MGKSKVKFRAGDYAILKTDIKPPNRTVSVKAGTKVYIQDVTFVAHNPDRYIIADEFGIISREIHADDLNECSDTGDVITVITEKDINDIRNVIQDNYEKMIKYKKERCDIKHLMEILDSKENSSVIFAIDNKAGSFRIDLVSNDGNDDKLMFRNISLQLMKTRIEELDKMIREYDKYFNTLSYYSFNERENPTD